ncbi:MAG: type IX secretion system protein PorQ [bacterium]
MHELPKRIILLFLLSFLFLPLSKAQIGGGHAYDFLSLTTSARIAGMGGNVLAIKDNDITLALANPSLITPEMHNQIAFSFINYFTGLNYGYMMYSRTFKKAGSFVGTFQFIDYGKFTSADPSGNVTGTFNASEYALNIGWGRQLGPHFSVGANGKLIYSALESYNSFGIAVDVAGTYTTLEQTFTASIIGRNIGSQIVPYVAGQYESLPFEIQIALSQKLKHIPVRFSQLITHLEKWDLTYTDPNDPANQKDPITGETKQKTGIGKFADNLMRHIVLGAEVTIAKILSIRIGYNYQRRQELKLYNKAGLAGFSLGVGVRVKMFNLSYTRASFNAGSPNPNFITLSVNLQEFSKKKQ